LTRLLELKFGQLPTDVVARVRNASSHELDRWTDRILTAASIEELFGDGA
jgi:hypothetical protein